MDYPIPLNAALPQGTEYYANFANFQVINPSEKLADFADAPIKRWRMKGLVPGQDYTFRYVQHDLSVQTMTMKGFDAGQLNLPGLRTVYQKYEDWLAARPKSQSTVSFSFFGSGFTRLVDSDDNLTLLFTPAEASAFAKLVPAGWNLAEAVPPSPASTYNWADNCRVWDLIAPGGARYSLGFMFRDASVKGVGAPGKFVVVDKDHPAVASLGGEPLVWVPTVIPTGEAETREIPLPQRDLLPGEKYVATLASTIEIAMDGTPATGAAPGTSDILGVAKETLRLMNEVVVPKLSKIIP